MFLFPSIRFLYFDACPWWERVNQERYGAQIYRNLSTDVYVRHNEYVKKLVPKAKLLEFRPEQGWKPLCEFLNVPIPEKEYPHALTSNEVRRDFFIGAAVGAALWLVIGISVSVGVWYVARLSPVGSRKAEL